MAQIVIERVPGSLTGVSSGQGAAQMIRFPERFKASLSGTPNTIATEGLNPESATGSCIRRAALDPDTGLTLPECYRSISEEELGQLALSGALPGISVETTKESESKGNHPAHSAP